MVQRCQLAYSTFNKYCVRNNIADGLPKPKPIGRILACIKVVISDNASNETKRENLMEGIVGHTLQRAKCGHHTLMLLAKDFLASDMEVLMSSFDMSKEKDAVIKEFSSSNVLNSLQYQIFKLFGHGWGSYVFGDGNPNPAPKPLP